MSIESMMPSNHHILGCPLLLPSIFPSIRIFSSESAFRIRWPKYWSFSYSIRLSNEYSGLISFKDWLVWSPCCPRDSQESFPAPQLESIYFSVLSHLYGPALTFIHDYWKNYSLTVWTFVIPLSPGSWCTQGFVCVLQKSLFSPILWKFCNQIPLTGIPSPFALVWEV